MTRESFVINVGKVTGGEGQTMSLLKLWKRDYYLLTAMRRKVLFNVGHYRLLCFNGGNWLYFV